jgi:CheY-like chemotaxis protein
MSYLALLVDDDPQTLFFLEQTLRPTGLSLLKAADGLVALDLLTQHTPQIVYLDLLLPRVPGLDVLSFIEETPRLAQTFVAIISAHDRVQFVHAPQMARANAYFVKPVRPKDIRACAAQAVGSTPSL